jgi:DNA-binding transcriptional LysR family regulator
LFIREGNEMQQTPRADLLAEPLRAALAQMEKALAGDQKFDAAGAERTFTLLGADFFSMYLMPKLSAHFRRTAPGIVLRFLDSARGDVERLLRDDRVDVALEGPLDLPDWVSRRRLFISPFMIVAARGNPALSGIKPGAKLPLDLFCKLPHAIRSIDGSLSGFTDQALAAAGRSRRVVLAMPHFQGVAAAVALGDLIAAVPVQFAEAAADGFGLEIYKPPVEIAVPEINMYWHQRHDRNPAHQWLREQILEVGDYRSEEEKPKRRRA